MLVKIVEKLENTDLQWIMAILIPIFKGCTKLALSKVMNRVGRKVKESAEILHGFRVNVIYGVFIATKMVATRISTMVCVIIVDFLLQFRMTYQVIRLDRKICVDETKY